MLWSYRVEDNTTQTSALSEISFIELIGSLWKEKILILVITMVVAVIAVAYAYLSTPIYQAEAQVLPPTPSDLASYNVAHQLSGPALAAITGRVQILNSVSALAQQRGTSNSDNSVHELTPSEVYEIFLRHLNSVSLRRNFFEAVYLPYHGGIKNKDAEESLWERFQKKLVVYPPKEGAGDEHAQITLDGKDPQRIASWVNGYLHMAVLASKKQILENLNSVVRLRIYSVNEQIDILRQAARADRQNEIVRLRNALALAEAIKLDDPPSSGNLITSYSGATTYLRGAKTLRAELKLLENRVSDDPYIPELPNLLKEKTLLQKININPEHLSVVTIDQPAIVPVFSIKPKKMAITIFGIIIGLILGTGLVVIRLIWKKIPVNNY